MTEFVKHDTGKRRLDLLPFRALELVCQALELGADRYGADNWRKCTDPSRYRRALLRHVWAVMKGEWFDPDSGLPHLAHVGANVLILLELPNEHSSRTQECESRQHPQEHRPLARPRG